MQSERYPVPFGWIKELDESSGLPSYVDTKADPPRRIWTHPYEDQEYLQAHPDVREKLKAGGFGGSDTNLLLPPSFEDSQRRHSYGGPPSSSRPRAASISPTGPAEPKHRGFFEMLKDLAIGTQEEREAEKKRRQEVERLRMEAQRRRVQHMIMARQQLYASQHGYGSHRRRPGGGVGMGLPLLGGLAGGMLLSGASDGGGGFCGGDFGGF